MGWDLRMRKSNDRRNTLPLGGNTYAIGETVFSVVDGARGKVSRTSTVVAPLVCVLWNGAAEDVIYPMDTQIIRKAWPWEN